MKLLFHLDAEREFLWRKRLKDTPVKSRRTNRRNQEG